MTDKQEYDKAHRAGKVLIAIIISILLVLTTMNFLDTLLSIVITWIWLFGVNTMSYLIETLLHWRHKHDRF